MKAESDRRKPRRSLDRGAAEAIAGAGLGFLASDPRRLDRFLAATGLSPDTIRAAAAEPGFLAAVLDHLAEDEALLVAFAADADLAPEVVMTARTLLAGRPGKAVGEA
jgi:hypothetical protein